MKLAGNLAQRAAFVKVTEMVAELEATLLRKGDRVFAFAPAGVLDPSIEAAETKAHTEAANGLVMTPRANLMDDFTLSLARQRSDLQTPRA